MVTGAFGWRCWRGLGYLLVGVAVTGLGWIVAVFTVVAGALLSLTVAGVRGVPGLLALLRAAAALERRRCALVLTSAPPSPYRAVGELTGRPLLTARLGDPATWRDLVWLLLAAPVNLACAVLACSSWLVGLGMVTVPIWYRFLPGGQARLYESSGVAHGVIGSVPAALPWALGGLAVLWLAGWSTRGLAAGQARLASAMLAPTRASTLRTRVADLTTTRAATLEGQHRELHRIERDLHDGAQARLVALSADLGMAGEAFDDDPAQARFLVEQARDGVVLALAELRDLVRGIGPPVLRDRGLAAALEAVAARSPIPVTTTVAIPARPAETVEAAAYFVVCEALANAAKHSDARHITVDVGQDGGACRVSVTDDGTGGVDPDGAGIRGLADRVAAIDGTLSISSPVGGPTVIVTVLPCGW
jgi:signal transduction histidine kinase